MHAMNDSLDIKKMGGLYKSMKFTAILMCIGSLALAGIYPFAGFFSKDLILGYAFIGFNHGIFLVLLITAFLTAFYSFRLIMLVFFTPKRHDLHPHEAGKIALLSMSPLMVLAIVSGFFEHSFFEFVGIDLVIIDAQNTLVMILASIAAILGVILAILAYKRNWFKPSLEQKWFYRLLENDYFIPRFYHYYIVKYFDHLCIIFRRLDIHVFDACVNYVAKFFMQSSQGLMMPNSLSLMLKFVVGAFVILLLLVWGI